MVHRCNKSGDIGTILSKMLILSHTQEMIQASDDNELYYKFHKNIII